MLRAPIPTALLAALCAGCVVGNLDLTGKACDGPHPCADGFDCVAGLCEPAEAATGTDSGISPPPPDGGGTDVGSCTAPPTCTSDHLGLRFCDGGVQPCGGGSACDFAACQTACGSGGSCPSGASCDEAANACVASFDCSGGGGCGQGAICLASVCLAPPDAGPGPGAPCAGEGDGGIVTVSGVVTLFPLADAASSLGDGGTVTFFYGADGGATAMALIQQFVNGLPGYQIELPPGPATALVQGPGLIPTWFPGLTIQPSATGAGTLLLETVVSADFAASLPSQVGFSPDRGHLIWVGRAAPLDPGCTPASHFLGGFTVGLAPAPGFLGYYRDDGTLSTSLGSSDPGLAEFIALDAPYAPTRYAIGVSTSSGPAALLAGTFTPPPFATGQLAAVSLVYPNFSW